MRPRRKQARWAPYSLLKIGRKPGIVTALIGRAVAAILIVVFISGVEN